MAVDQVVQLGGVKQRAVARDQQDPLGAELERAVDAVARRLVVALLLVLEHHRAVAGGDPLRAVVAGHDQHHVDQRATAQRDQDVGEHRLGKYSARGPIERLAEALLGFLEAFDRQDREGVWFGHRANASYLSPSVNSSVRAASARRPSAPSISTSVSSTGSPAAG